MTARARYHAPKAPTHAMQRASALFILTTRDWAKPLDLAGFARCYGMTVPQVEQMVAEVRG